MAYGQGTFPGRNFITVGSSTNTRVTGSGQLFFALYQAACTQGGS